MSASRILLSLLFACCLLPLTVSDAALTDDLQFAAALFNDGEYRQALDEFIRLKPQLAGNDWEDDVLFWSAECHFHLGEYDPALALYRTILSNFPAFPRLEDVYVKVLGALYADNQFSEVVSHAEQFTRKFPGSSHGDEVYLLWIQSALRLKQFTRAEDLLDQYQKSTPGSPYLWSLKSVLAYFYLKEQRFDRALPFFEQLHAYQKDVNFLLWVGECRFQTSAWAAAKDAFALFLLEQPSNDLARFKLGLCEYRLGQFSRAVDALLPLTSRENDHEEDALYFVAQSFLQMGRGEEARQNLSSILKLSPNEDLRSRATAQLIEIESSGKDIGKMIEAYEKLGAAVAPEQLRLYRVYSAFQKKDYRSVVSLLANPVDRREHLMLAESLYALGQYPDAERAYHHLLKLSGPAAEKKSAYAGLGWSAYAQERYEESIKYFQSYVSLDPAAPADAHLAMAQAALAMGQQDLAVLFYDRARKASPEPKKISKNLGILYFNSGNYQRALDSLLSVADDDQVLSIIGRSYLYIKQPAKALVYFRRLSRPERYALEIGAVHYELGQFEEAKTYFERAAQAPGAAAGINIDEFLGIIAYNQGNYAEAASRFRKAQLRDPDNVEIRFELAASLMRVENAPQQELVEILRALVTHSGTPRSYRDKARMWLARKSTSSDVRGALEEIGGIESSDDRAAALEARATHFFSLQAYDTAVLFYEKLLSSTGLSAESRMQGLYGMGWSLHKLGRKSRAEEMFRQLMTDYPKTSYGAEAVLLLVEEAFGSGRYADAADLAGKFAGKVSKNAARLRFMAAESLYETGRYAEALAHYKAFLPEADNLADYVRYRAGLAAFHVKQYEPSIALFSQISDSSLLERKHYYLGMSMHHLGRKKQAAQHFEHVVEMARGDFQDEAWKNLVILMEELGLWRKVLAYGTRLSESAQEVERLVYAKALYHTESTLAARYAEQLGYISRDPDVGSQSLYLAAGAYNKSDPGRARKLFEKIISKYPQSAAAAESKKALSRMQ